MLLARKFYTIPRDIFAIWWNISDADRNRRRNNISMPKNPRKDNGNIRNTGSESGGSNTIRYPCLKRSKATWRKFYELFPDAE